MHCNFTCSFKCNYFKTNNSLIETRSTRSELQKLDFFWQDLKKVYSTIQQTNSPIRIGTWLDKNTLGPNARWSQVQGMDPSQELGEGPAGSSGHALGQVGHLVAVVGDSSDVEVEPVVAGDEFLQENRSSFWIWFPTILEPRTQNDFDWLNFKWATHLMLGTSYSFELGWSKYIADKMISGSRITYCLLRTLDLKSRRSTVWQIISALFNVIGIFT